MVDDFRHDLLGFDHFVPVAQYAQRIAVAQLAPEFFLERVRIVRNQMVGDFQDAAGRAVILLQLDDLEPRVVFLQLCQVFGLSAAPGVDGLVVVADYGEPAQIAGNQLDELVLRDIRILIFIDEQVADLVLPFFQHGRLLLKQQHGQQDQVVEIDGVVGLQAADIVVVKRGRRVLLRRCRRYSQLWRDEGVFPLPDLPGIMVDFVDIAVFAVMADQVAQQGKLVLFVEQRQAGLVAQRFMLRAQDFQAQRVKRRNPEAAQLLVVQQLGNAAFHFARGLVGESHGGDIARRYAALGNQIGDFFGNHARLAAAGAGQH